MVNTDVTQQLNDTFYGAINQVVDFLPELVAGLIILLVGWLVATVLKTATKKGLDALEADKWLDDAGVAKGSSRDTWLNLLASLVFWTVFIIFLIPALEAWGLLGVTNVISEIVAYIPNVLAAIIVGFLGFVFANLASQLVLKTARGYGAQVASMLSGIARWSILIFSGLIVINQLGIAPGLIQIFFGALMFAFALAAGLAFGLGGRQKAAELLEKWSKATPAKRR